MIYADVNFKPLIETYIATLRSQGYSDEDIRLHAATQQGEQDFIDYCDACIKLDLATRKNINIDDINIVHE